MGKKSEIEMGGGGNPYTGIQSEASEVRGSKSRRQQKSEAAEVGGSISQRQQK